MRKAGLILAGGKSSRMGLNKALIELGGKAVVTRVTESLLQVTSEIIVTVAKDAPLHEYRRRLPQDVLIMRDKMDSSTPLVGIISGLEELQPCYCITLSCDLPFVSPKVLQRLFQEAEGYDATIPQWPNGRIEPLHAVYRSEKAEAAAREAYADKEWANRDMVKRLKMVRMVPTESLRTLDPDLLTFFNMNSPADMKQAEMIAQRLDARRS